MSILVTGGLGYIGSHTVIELIKAGKEVIVLDNMSNTSRSVLNQIEKITGVRPVFYHSDLIYAQEIRLIFKRESIDSIIHLAAIKPVGEAAEKSLDYYNNNLIGTLNLLNVMQEFKVRNLIYPTSSVTSNSMVEEILRDISKVYHDLNVAILTYTTPVGNAIGKEMPNNLRSFNKKAAPKCEDMTQEVTESANTINVVELAKIQVKALDILATRPGLLAFSGVNTAADLEIDEKFNRASGQ